MSDIASLNGPMALPAAGGDPQSLVILLHGYGSNGDDLIGLAPYWRDTLPHTAFLSPNAPEICPGAPGGFQWWGLGDMSRTNRAEGVRQPAPVLNAFIDAQLARFGLSEDRLVLAGFSQGTMMALHVGPRRAKALAGILGYSGMLADPEALATEGLSKPPILLVHGDADPMVPFAALPAAESALTGQGFAVETLTCPGLGHSIDLPGLQRGGAFLTRVLDT